MCNRRALYHAYKLEEERQQMLLEHKDAAAAEETAGEAKNEAALAASLAAERIFRLRSERGVDQSSVAEGIEETTLPEYTADNAQARQTDSGAKEMEAAGLQEPQRAAGGAEAKQRSANAEAAGDVALQEVFSAEVAAEQPEEAVSGPESDTVVAEEGAGKQPLELTVADISPVSTLEARKAARRAAAAARKQDRELHDALTLVNRTATYGKAREFPFVA